jgi:hypothetical protein
LSALSCADRDSGSSPAPAAALPPIEDEDDALPPAALEPLEELAFGHEQFALGVLMEPLTDVLPMLPWTFVWSGQVHDADGADPPDEALPLTFAPPEAEDDGADEEPEAAEGEDVLLDEAEEPEELGEPVLDDWLVCAPWFIVEDELVSVDVWPAATPLFTDWLPLPTLTPGLMLAPALMSVLLMPTLASTPTFGFTLTPLLVEPDAALGLVLDD